MGKSRTILLILGALILLTGVGLFLIGYFKPKGAGILIETNPLATVFIDNVQVGRSRYEATREGGEVVIKLVPESNQKALTPYEAKVTLISGIQTVIRREFGQTSDEESGEIISFEKVSGNETSLAVVSLPDAAQISIDGATRGFAPYKTASIVPGEHQLIISADGYKEKILSVRTQEGYKLTAVVKLAKDINAVASPTPESQDDSSQQVTLVEILSTPTGFLRVRSEPSTLATEVAQVKPGEKYLFIEQDEKTGWFKIEYQKGKEGWVTNQYSKKTEGVLSTPSPTPKTKASPTPFLH